MFESFKKGLRADTAERANQTMVDAAMFVVTTNLRRALTRLADTKGPYDEHNLVVFGRQFEEKLKASSVRAIGTSAPQALRQNLEFAWANAAIALEDDLLDAHIAFNDAELAAALADIRRQYLDAIAQVSA